MELVSIDNTRVIYLFHFATPAGPPLPFTILNQLAQRYSFMSYPTKYEDISQERIELRQGAFENSRIELLELYSDGCVITSKTNTKVLDAFLEDVKAWVSNDLGYQIVKTHQVDRIYESYLIVKMPETVWKNYERYEKVQKKIGQTVKVETGIDAPFEPWGLSWSADVSTLPGLKPIPFRLERRSGIAFDLALYFSAAPLRTDTHLEILKELEDLN